MRRPASLAPWLLCLLRFGQGVGLGGEWGGAALLATENAPAGRRAWFGMFPQLGPPIGFLLANGLFLILLLGLGEADVRRLGVAHPLPAQRRAGARSASTSGFRITETPAFRAAMARRERVRVPLLEVAARARAAAAARGARHRRLLCAVLHLDGFRARLRRQFAAHSAHRPSSPCSASPSSSWR